ncbi:uncharacterized protein LOC132035423 isoform X2 [Lycium ferocissimum]|uniref:uncharacterized protein LOC132035423 isoform X2 n=1 Tax=Lycium ferocissimum TaxID=112874 RepID=UPI002816041B|nr:uncharacterized protein LOC132035423 isoform X2 [Lycium ferocissimum]
MAASTSTAYNTYPYPSTLNVANFVTIKLSDSSNYRLWKAQMLCLLRSQELFGFVDGTIQPPNEHGNGAIANQDYCKWEKSDQLVKGWIFGSLAKEMLQNVAEKVSARDVWLELEDICCLKFPDEPEGMRAQPTIDESVESNKDYKYYLPLYEALLCGNLNKAETFLMIDDEEGRAQNTSSLQTALYVAIAERNDIEDSVPSENNDKYSFIEKLVDLMADDDGLAKRNWLGETPLHYAARFDNLRAAEVLVNKNPKLPHLACYNGLYPIHLAVEYGYKSKDLVPYFFNVTEDPAPYTGRAGFRLLYRLICSELFDLATDLIERFPDLAKYSNESSPLSLLATRPSAFHGPLDKYKIIRLLWAEPSGSTAVYLNIFQLIIDMQAKIFGSEKPVKLAERLCRKLENLSEEEIKSMVSGPLLEAARVDNYKLVRIILQRFPSSVDYCNKKNGQNILHIATENHSTRVFKMLNGMSRHHWHYLMS